MHMHMCVCEIFICFHNVFVVDCNCMHQFVFPCIFVIFVCFNDHDFC